MTQAKTIEILLVEDSPGDVLLTMEAMKEAKVLNRVSVITDGAEAMAFLRKEGKYKDSPRPDLILLDLNLPKMSGREVLAEVKEDPDLRIIPTVILTVSDDEHDILESYSLHANCYITKPLDLERFMQVTKIIDEFWLSIVKLPRRDA